MAPEHLWAQSLSDAELVQLSGEFEGHPDNAAASVPVAPSSPGPRGEGEQARYSARRLKVDPRIRATAFISHTESATSHTRGLLPDSVPRCDAVFNVSRTAVAVHALTSEPDLPWPPPRTGCTRVSGAGPCAPRPTWSHNRCAAGYAATISGAGPPCWCCTPQTCLRRPRSIGASRWWRRRSATARRWSMLADRRAGGGCCPVSAARYDVKVSERS